MTMAAPAPLLKVDRVGKSFTMHLQGSTRLPVVQDVSFDVAAGECVVLGGPSGAGKSSLLKIVYGNYRCDHGSVLVADADETVDVAAAEPRRMIRLRRTRLAYVSQFLRVIPRVSAIDLVVQAAVEFGLAEDEGRRRARDLLTRLNVPEPLWTLAPATFSGGEQQRINIARGFVADHDVLLLDEPTASLDGASEEAVVTALLAARDAGRTVIVVAHRPAVVDVADIVVHVGSAPGDPVLPDARLVSLSRTAVTARDF
jgi:alpha-D-ribose 1-methylphosphonate 5-triphosphate synthase subunit PhnL